MDLAEFLLARFTEAEERVKYGDAHWADCEHFQYFSEGGLPCTCGLERHLLDDLEAKRRIVALHAPDEGEPQECSLCNVMIDTCCGAWEFELWPCRTLVALALPYADHPDYDPAWSPAVKAATP